MAGFRSSKSVRGAQLDCLEPRLLFAADLLPADSSAQPGIGHPAQLSPEAELTLAEIHATTGVDVAHDLNLTGLGQTVVVIDSGVAYDHPDLGGGLGASYRVVGGWDFTEENDADPYDDGPAGFHGTHVAGILGSSDATHRGVAPDVDIVALRIFNDLGRGKLSWLEQSLQWVVQHVDAYEHPITTVNMSLGTNWNSLELPDYAKLEDELQQLEALGIMVVAAAGNSFGGDVGLSYPAVSPYVLPAASHAQDGAISNFSQRHTSIVVAPGEDVASTVPDYVGNLNGTTDDFFAASGTSMASPYLAGASILVRQAMARAGITEITVDAIRDVLYQSADDVHDALTGQAYRKLNVEAAVRSVLVAAAPPATPITNVVDLGSVSSAKDYPLPDAMDALTFTPQFDGLWSIELQGQSFRIGGSSATYTDHATVLATGDVPVSINVMGAETADTMRVAPHVTVRDSYLVVTGTAAPDVVTIDETLRVEFNGASFVPDTASITRVVVEGRGDHDRLAVLTDSDSARAEFSPGRLNLTSQTVAVTAVDFETIEVFASGEHGMASFAASPGADEFFAKPTHSWMRGDGFLNYMRGAEHVVAWANDPRDKAVLDDSPQDDVVYATSGRVSIQGPDFDTHAMAFSEVVVRSDAGGSDRAELFGTAGPDEVIARPEHALLRRVDSTAFMQGFDDVVVHGNGGDDTARVYDSTANDRFVASAGDHRLLTPETMHHLVGFATVDVYSLGGHDVAEFQASAVTDQLVAKPTHSWLTHARDARTYARGFEEIVAHGEGVAGRALLYDSPATGERLLHRADQSIFSGPGFRYEISAFRNVHGISQGGDLAVFSDDPGTDLFFAEANVAKIISEAGNQHVAEGFEDVLLASSLDANLGAAILDRAHVDLESLAMAEMPTDAMLSNLVGREPQTST